MSRYSFQKFVSLLVSFSMLWQNILPAVIVPPVTALSQPTAQLTNNPTNQQTNSLTNATATQPAVLAYPVSISRVQSGYQAGSTLVISYTVTNNLPPVLSPDIPAGATVTDTVDILAAFDINSDPNTLHNVVLTDTLTAASFITSTFTPAQSGSDFTWTLPDLPPQASQTLAVTVQPPASAADFTDLDTGMAVSGQLWGMTVSDVARTAVLIPDSISPTYTQPTIDADSGDKDMLWKTAEFSQDPLALFAFVQGMGYDPYKGSLRGTRGTLWGEAGNSIDQSSLLIAMLRAAGVPARYRHGALSQTDAQTLLASMFPAMQGVGGVIEGTIADPLNDPALLAIAQDHWWVEAYLPGSGWTDLDPAFPGTAVGDAPATPATDGTDQIAELPDNLRHHITIRLKVEQYSTFPIGGSNL
ncbi:MAG: transglutaminase domain-containing protein, partial [Anaerolineae bacterium]